MRTPYFAYGSNMASQQMRTLCASPAMLGVAAVPGYVFRIAKRGYATIVPDPDAIVYGLLWSLTENDLRALDEFEQVDDGHYVRTTVLVPFEGEPIEAQVYLAADPAPGSPQAGYLEEVVRAAKELGLPREYITTLEQRA